MKRVRRAIAKEKKRRSRPDVDGLDILNKDKLSIVASSKVIKEQKAKIAKKQITLQKSFATNEKLHKLDRKRAGILKIARNAYRTMEKAEKRLTKVVSMQKKAKVETTKGNGVSFMKSLV